MVTTKKRKLFYFVLFLLPAMLLYSMFFVMPFIQGIKYSMTDWNGIVPEIPFSMSKADFDAKITAKLSLKADLKYLHKFYILDEDGLNYHLNNWIKDGGKSRPINKAEKGRIKNILASVGMTPIKFVGLENYRQMFERDVRFVPRTERQFLFNEFDDLPETITARAFNNQFLNHVRSAKLKAFVLANYRYQNGKGLYRLKKEISEKDTLKLQGILAKTMYKTIFIPGVIGFTLFFTACNVLFANLLALVLALILDTKIRTKNIMRSVFFFPNVLSLVIVAFIWSFVFRLIMPMMTGISIWLGSPDLAPFALLMVTIWQGCGWLMVIYIAGLQTIPTDVLEGAQIDGANWWQRFRNITMPLLVPAFTICLFFSLSNSLKTFDIIMTLTQGGPGYVTTPIVLDIYYNAFRDNLYGYATAKAIFLCAVIMIITGFQLFFMKRREVEL